MTTVRAVPVVALCLGLLLPGAALARAKTEPVYTPTIALATKATPAQVKKGVKMAVLSRKWTISNEKGNSFEASYTKPERRGGDLTARIRITYSTKEVTVAYVSSDNMGYDGSSINRYYNSWVKNLEKDIPIYIEREVVSSE